MRSTLIMDKLNPKLDKSEMGIKWKSKQTAQTVEEEEER